MAQLVALTTTSTSDAGKRHRVSLYSNYLTVLDRLDLTPVLVTPAHSLRSIGALVQQCSGLVLSGGEDVDPVRYGEAPVPELGEVSPARDAMEFAALTAALSLKMPILGICRGCQVLNVCMGGTLYQDLETQHATRIRHTQTEPWGRRTHRAVVERDSRLHTITNSDELCINSFHHQAIKDLAPGLRISARAEDGLVEAVESSELPWLVGVQWHPERHEASAGATDPDRRLFADFARAVREFRA